MGTKKDFTQIAFGVVQQATGEAPKPKRTVKQESGRIGGLKGGRTRMEALSPEQRAELAKKAAAARWGKAAAPAKKAGAGRSKKVS